MLRRECTVSVGSLRAIPSHTAISHEVCSYQCSLLLAGNCHCFSSLLRSHKAHEYFCCSFVSMMGACFDTLSFFVTLDCTNAIRSTKSWHFVLHLSLDLVLAFLAMGGFGFCCLRLGTVFCSWKSRRTDDRSAVIKVACWLPFCVHLKMYRYLLGVLGDKCCIAFYCSYAPFFRAVLRWL